MIKVIKSITVGLRSNFSVLGSPGLAGERVEFGLGEEGRWKRKKDSNVFWLVGLHFISLQNSHTHTKCSLSVTCFSV